jgi:hypothetical protein
MQALQATEVTALAQDGAHDFPAGYVDTGANRESHHISPEDELQGASHPTGKARHPLILACEKGHALTFPIAVQ